MRDRDTIAFNWANFGIILSCFSNFPEDVEDTEVKFGGDSRLLEVRELSWGPCAEVNTGPLPVKAGTSAFWPLDCTILEVKMGVLEGPLIKMLDGMFWLLEARFGRLNTLLGLFDGREGRLEGPDTEAAFN